MTCELLQASVYEKQLLLTKQASHKMITAYILLQLSTAQEKLYNELDYYLVTLHDNTKECQYRS
jgi:hypothetical protein